jgi:hypothetical protein
MTSMAKMAANPSMSPQLKKFFLAVKSQVNLDSKLRAQKRGYALSAEAHPPTPRPLQPRAE